MTFVQLQVQKDHIGEQNQRCRDLEASTRQLEERCSELKESAAGHELRAKEAAAEVLKGNRIIEKVSVGVTSWELMSVQLAQLYSNLTTLTTPSAARALLLASETQWVMC